MLKKSILLLSLVFLAVFAEAQQVHFIYMQSEQQQPFYVRLDNKLLSSSAAGYLVIPKLTRGTYSLSIGFPRNEWPSQVAEVEIRDKDLGYLLKNFGDKGWGLFNLQTMEVVSARSSDSKKLENNVVRNDEFSSVLADVVNTPSIKESVETPKPPVAKKEEQKEVVAVGQPEVWSVVSIRSIELLSSSNSATEMKRVYVDQTEAGLDTVEVILDITPLTEPSEVEQAAATENITPAPDKEKVQETKKANAQPNEPKFLDISVTSEPTKNEVPAAKPAEKERLVQLQMINSDCKQLANDDDFVKVRKKIAAQKSDDKMIEAARKSFRQKCFSTEQVKNLGRLFITDEGRYKFFDTSYPHVHDTANFPGLEAEFTDAYIISRFKAMIR